MEVGLLCYLLAPLCALLVCGTSAIDYHGSGESNRITFGGFKRHTRQAQPTPQVATTEDSHTYYTSAFHRPGSQEAERLWFDLRSFDDSELEIIPESGISDSFRVFDAHDLPFDFQFYGHTINLVAVTTGGFLYTSDYLHSRIHLTQYIAPLQADFNPGFSSNASVLIHSGNERFTVQWDRVHVTGHESDGEFTFQVSLFRNGTIHFVYRNMPLLVSSISDDEHPVEVGVADSFYVDRPIPPNLILRQVFEYSRIRLPNDNLNFSAYVLDPIPGCVAAGTCQSCVNASRTSSFDCGWCPRLNRCSDGFDRFRQEWFQSGCAQDSSTTCPGPESAKLSTSAVAGISVGLVAVFILLVLIVMVVVGILVYGYKNPTSSVGLFMIEHRPKARSLNKSKASYSVDSGKANLSED